VIAEGIEHRDQLEFLRDMGCDYIQGFLFSKPMPLDEFQAVLRSGTCGQ
jgi:EAL domain-containing protein (putative c-di-GMP-specific phosphodiesterase class I)